MPDVFTKEAMKKLFEIDAGATNRWAYYLPPCNCGGEKSKYGVCVVCYGLKDSTKRLQKIERIK